MITVRLPIFILVVLSLLVSAGCLKPIVFEGGSMQPSFHDGDRILMSDNLGDLRRSDIIYFRYPKDETKFYMKRIIGLPGEKVEVKNGTVFVNDKEIDETPYLDPNLNRLGVSFPARIVDTDSYYVLGDNRDNSSDSRYWGTVSRSKILGKFCYRYYSAETN